MSLSTRGFGSDNHAGIHPLILEKIVEANQGHVASYGVDPFSRKAQELFQTHFGNQTQGFFVFNGTAANCLALSVLMQSGEAVFCSDVAHILVDESAGPEFFLRGKIIPVPSVDGKISVEALEERWIRRGDIHFAQASVVSITQPTEFGTLYSIDELKKIISWCKERKLKVHLDGARLGVAAAALKISFRELTSDLGFDAVSFGGTKNGMMGAEAVLVFEKSLAQRLQVLRKQSGQLPSKSRFLAAQFVAYLENNLWRDLAEKSIAQTRRLKEGLKGIPGVKITRPSEANALFVQIPQAQAKRLREKFFFYVWDEKTWECRWMISWDLQDSDIDEFLQLVRETAQ